MAKMGRTNITNADVAGKNAPRAAYTFDGEPRIDRRPVGTVERFVDPQGNVMNLQLASPGAINKADAIAASRVRYHNSGFVEHAKCPIKHGTRYASRANTRAFADLPDALQSPCENDVRTLVRHGNRLEATKACPHIEWLITSLREKDAAENAERNKARAAAERAAVERRELEQISLEIAREELEAKRAKNRKSGTASGTAKSTPEAQ